MWMEDYARVERAIHFLERRVETQPTLEEVAASVRLSPYHFQRMFSRWAGISPKRFLQALTLNHAKAALADSQSVLDAAFAAGLSGPSRLHDLFVTVEAVTPGEFKAQGAGLPIRYGFHPTPFGLALIAATPRGLCHLSFVGEGRRAALGRLTEDWARAEIREDAAQTAPFAGKIFGNGLAGGRSSAAADLRGGQPLTLLLKGTPFQHQVWQALLRIPPGGLAAYDDIARAIGRAGAARAVGRAVGDNPIAYLIPCHRVIRKSGAVGEYRWGTARKRAILAWEAGSAKSA